MLFQNPPIKDTAVEIVVGLTAPPSSHHPPPSKQKVTSPCVLLCFKCFHAREKFYLAMICFFESKATIS
jgi:hypothetical protein